MINILDGSGSVITNNTASYHSAGTIGNLIYQEMSGLNTGESLFKFMELGSSTATVSYTDGSTDEFSAITILDANGGVLKFPKPGEVFYIRVEIPGGETRTVSKIEPHFTVKYYTKINGKAYLAKAVALRYELTIDRLMELCDSKLTP